MLIGALTDCFSSIRGGQFSVLNNIRAQGHHEVAPDAHVGDALVEAADMCGADLVVMGAYGHSRLRDVAFGGATHHVLGHTTVPVLMAH